MKLIGNLKKKVDNAQTKEEVRDAIKKAGMLLDDDELEAVSGGNQNLGNKLKSVALDSICVQDMINGHQWIGRNAIYICKKWGCFCEPQDN